MHKESKIYIAGHTGLVGSAILSCLKSKGYRNLVFSNRDELDLTNQLAVERFFSMQKPDYVILAAAKVGGIMANNRYRADFIYENTMIQNNVIHQSYRNNVQKLLFLASTCVYPKYTTQPISEDSLLTSELEYTNEPYAIAKISGLKMCESYNIQYNTNFITVMPTNLYGPNDNFDLETSHVLPALIRKIHLAKCLDNNDWDSIRLDLAKNPMIGIDKDSKKSVIISCFSKYGINKGEVNIWGSGNPKREFLWSEDMADACIFLLNNINANNMSSDIQKEVRNTHINIGTGIDLSINDLADKIKSKIGYQGIFTHDTSKPDGTNKKCIDVSKIHSLGWKHSVDLDQGIEKLYSWYLL